MSVYTSNSSYTSLDGGPLASHCSQHVGRLSCQVSYHKRTCQGHFTILGSKGSAINASNPLAAQRCVVQTGVLFLNLIGSGRGNLSIYDKDLPAILERMGRFLCSRKHDQTMPFFPR